MNGWIVPSHQSAPLSFAMDRVRRMDIADREKIGNSGRERMSQLFEQGNYREALLKYYMQLLKLSKTPASVD